MVKEKNLFEKKNEIIIKIRTSHKKKVRIKKKESVYEFFWLGKS